VIIKTCVFSLSLALCAGLATAQTKPGPIVNGRHLQPSQQQVDNLEDYGIRQQDRAVQSEIDRLYDEIMRVAARRGR
jgi:hypothetical protein